MRARRLAAAGLALAGVGYALWLPNMVAFSFWDAAFTTVMAAGTLVAAAGLALPDGRRGRNLLAGGMVLGAAGRVASYALGPFGDITATNGLLSTAGWVLAAWFALLLATEPAPRPGRVGGLRVGLLTTAVGNGLWIPYNVVTGTWEWMPGNTLLLLGTVAAAWALGRQGREPAAQEPVAAPAQA